MDRQSRVSYPGRLITAGPGPRTLGRHVDNHRHSVPELTAMSKSPGLCDVFVLLMSFPASLSHHVYPVRGSSRVVIEYSLSVGRSGNKQMQLDCSTAPRT